MIQEPYPEWPDVRPPKPAAPRRDWLTPALLFGLALWFATLATAAFCVARAVFAAGGPANGL